MEASKVTDAVGLTPGYSLSQADARQAYIQADLDDTEVETWVRLPVECWPDEWLKTWDPKAPLSRRPVVRLCKALYGHP